MINGVKGRISFQGRRIYNNIRVNLNSYVENTTGDEDKKDLSKIMSDLANTNKSKITSKRQPGYYMPVLKTDAYKIAVPANGNACGVNSIHVTDLKSNITRVFTSSADNHEARTLFKDCLNFIRKTVYPKASSTFKGF